MKSSLMRRIEALKRRRRAPAMVSAQEVASVKSALFRKLGFTPKFEERPAAPISLAALDRAAASVRLKLVAALDRHRAGT
jgi:hypothetical protein